MLLQMRKHDGTVEEIEVLRSGFAREIATSFDWDAERRRFEQLIESEAICFLPSISFLDDSGRILEFGPNSDDSFWVSYRYSTMKSSFGFCPVEYGHEQVLQECLLGKALELIELHYRTGHQEIVDALPPEEHPELDPDECD
jgi:hypothetical protein